MEPDRLPISKQSSTLRGQAVWGGASNHYYQKNPRVRKILVLSGMFRRSASLAIPHLESFAAIPSVSPVQLGHTNRNVFLSHESQREIALV